MTEALLHRFTREDFHRMGENGTLAPDERVELLNGQVVHMFSLGSRHSYSVSWLTDRLVIANGGRWAVWTQSSLNLGEHYEPLPDLMLLRPPLSRYHARIPTAADVFLLIEVSDSSVTFDREEKLPAYAAAGLPEFWLVNTKSRIVEVYRKPEGSGYVEHFKVRVGEVFSPAMSPDVVLSVAELFNAQ